MFGRVRTWRSSVMANSFPVASPSACRIRPNECPPSRPLAIGLRLLFSSIRSNRMPHWISSSIRAGPDSTTSRTIGSSHSPAPAPSVSLMCDSNESVPSSTAAIPPWAQ